MRRVLYINLAVLLCMIFRNSRKVMIVERIGNIWTIIGRKRLSKKNFVRFRGKAYLINPEISAYVSRKFITYYISTDGEQLTFNEIKQDIQGELIEDIFCKQLVRQLSSSLNTSPISWAIVGYVALGLLAGIPLGALIAPYLGVM